jgi:selenocysteine lyase/cysteine desulfurase
MLRDAGFTVHDEGRRQCGIVTTSSARADGPGARELLEVLNRYGITASTTLTDSSLYDVERRNLPPMLRLSVHYTTTPGEIADTVDILSGV